MSLFNNYNKPGPGVSKNDGIKANRFLLYFQLLGRKFWNICLLNLTMFLYTIPYLALTYGLFVVLGNLSFFQSIPGFTFRLLLSALPFGFYGPVLGAAFKIGRDFVREQPVFLFSEFWSAFKGNLIKTIGLSFVAYFFACALAFALPTYLTMGGVGSYLLFPLCMIAALVLLFAQFYVYTMATCFTLSFKEIAKNGGIFSFLCIFRNLLILIVLAILGFLCVELLIFSFSFSILFALLMFLLACFLPAFFIYTVSFITDPALQRYVVDPYYAANPQMTSAVLKKTTTDEEEEKAEPKPEVPEYVYHNGRMVHRSVLESESLFDDRQMIRRNDSEE